MLPGAHQQTQPTRIHLYNVGPTLYKCSTNVLCLLAQPITHHCTVQRKYVPFQDVKLAPFTLIPLGIFADQAGFSMNTIPGFFCILHHSWLKPQIDHRY